jgi:predicted kinase
MLVVQMHGVPGSGKSTLARALGQEINAVVLDKDVIKAALLRSGLSEEQAAPASYEAFFALARALTQQGRSVILDNPVYWPGIEENWRAVAAEAGSPLLMIECVCADRAELARRLAERPALESQPRDLRDWRRLGRDWEPTGERLVVNTTRPFREALAEAVAYVRAGVAA